MCTWPVFFISPIKSPQCTDKYSKKISRFSFPVFWCILCFDVAKLEVLNWRHNRPQSPVFGLAVLYPTGSQISRCWYIKTRGRKIAIEHFSLLCILVHWGHLIEQIKKNLSYNFGMSRKPQDSSRLPLVNFSRCRHHRYPLGNTKVDGNTTTKFINFATVVFALLYMFVVLAVFSLIFPKWQPTKRTCGIINFRTKTSFVFLVLVGELVDFEKACSFLNRVCDWLSKQ